MGEAELVIAIPLFEGLTLTDAIGPYEVLGCIPGARILFVTQKAGTCVSPGYRRTNLKLVSDASFDSVPAPDVIVIPGGPIPLLPLDDQPLLDWIRKAHETSMYTTTVCTGSLLLGAAGILDGVEATTHWEAFKELESYGAKAMKKRYIHEGKIITAAGVSSGIDMAVYLVSLLKDADTAKAVQLLIEYDPTPPFDVNTIENATPGVIAALEKMSSCLVLHGKLHSI